MDDQTPEVTDQDRLDSAHKLFGRNAEATLATIDSIPNPAAQSDPSTRNVVGVDDPARWVIPQVDVAPTGDMQAAAPRPKGPAFLDAIPDASAPRQPAGASAPAAPQPSFLSSIPDVSSPLQQAHQDASLFDATHAAIVRRLSNQFGEPPEFIDKNLKTAQAQANAPSPAFFKSMEALYPGSSKFFQQHDNMAVAHDDIPNTVGHEAVVNAASDQLSLWGAFKLGLSQSVAGDVYNGGKTAPVPKDLSIPQSLAMQAGQVIPDLPVMAMGAAAAAPIGAALGSEVPVVGNIAGAAVAGGAGAMGAPTAAHQLLAMYRSGQIQSFPDLVRAFGQMEKQVGKQMLVGGITSTAGLLAGPAGPAIAIPLENAVMTTAGKLIEGETPKPRDYLENMLLGLGLHAVTPHATPEDAAKVAETQQGAVKQNFYDNIGSVAEQSKLRERLPGVHSDFVGGLVKNSPFQDVYLPVDAATAYFQEKGMDLDDVAQSLGATDALREARATGGDIKIPLATWLEKMVGTEHYKALRNDIKFSPEDLSPNQTAAIQSETRARVQSAADEALKGADVPADADQQSRLDAASRVYQDMQEKLSSAGLTAREVKYNPMLFRDFFSTLADRVNQGAPEDGQVKADDLAQRFPLDVSKFETPLDRDAARAQEYLAGKQAEAGTLREVSQGSRQERLALARKALESISDLHKDDAAEAFGLPKNAVRALRGVSERQGRGTYSHEEIHAAAGLKAAEGTPNTFEQKAATATDRLERAKAMGFDTETKYFHGTTGDFKTFKPSDDGTFGPGVYLTRDANAAGYYSGGEGEGGSVLPLHIRSEKPFRVEEGFKIPKADAAKMEEVLGDGFMKETLPKNRNAADWWKSALGVLTDRLQEQEGLSETEAYHKARPMMVEAIQRAGYDSFHALDTSVVFDPKNVRSINADFEKSGTANILAQGEEDNPRGQISFAGRQFNIDLFKEKDVSTFLHETGHYFLEVMGHVVEGEGAGSEGLQKDYASILKFLGVNSRDEIGTEQHEKFARAFEKYLSEGKAPNEGLREAFGQFKRWLTGLWKKVSFQNVDVSPELRSVFDRMLSTEQDIEGARKEVDLDREFSLDGLDDKTKTEIQGLREKARARAEETLLKERMKETTEEYRANLEKERAQFREAAEAQVKEEPLFKAIDQLRESLSGKDPYETADAALRGELPPDQATEFEMLADEHGFTTAEEMARQISEAGANNEFESKVGAMVDEALRNVGAIKDPAELREEALKAVHSDDTGELLAREREALLDLAAKRIASKERSARNRTQAKLEMEAAKGEAGMILAKLPASEAGRPQRFITQEKNAAARVARFVARGDFEKAAEAKQQQLVAHALVSESFKINEEAGKHTKYIEKFMNRKGSLLDMPFGFVRQLDGLLDRFGFQPLPKEDLNTLSAIASGMAQEGEDGNAIADATGLVQDAQGRWSPESLSQFQERRNEGYQAFQFPPEVLAAVRRESKDLTIDELRSVRETMQAIAEGGRKNDRFLNELHKVDIKEAAKKFREKIEATYGKPYEESLLPGKTEQGKLADMLDTLRQLPDALTRTLDTVLTTCHKFDGLEEGPAKEFIYRPMAEAEARKTTRTRESMREMEEIFGKHYEPSEFEKYKDTEVALNGRKYTKENILSMALNWGNGGNRQRLLSMPGLDEASVRQLFTHLGKKDWDFVQATWEHIDKYWPEIKKLEMAVRGVEPAKVEGIAFKNEHGTYKGGYYPIAYDFEKSADAFQHNQSKDALFKQYSTARAATSQGHVEARQARVTRPLRLSLDVLANHHEDIIHDLEFRKAVIDLNRFLNERDTKVGITNAVGVKGFAAIQDWLKSVAGGGSEPMTAWDRAAQWFRFKTTFFNLGYRIASAPKIALENTVNTASEIGWSGTARAIKNYYLGDGSHEMVVEKSPFMRERANHLDRDMGDLIDKQRGEGQSAFQKYAFFTHAYIDQGMSFPLWSDAYKRAISDHGDERLAVHQADETVKRTFMTGGGVDQASFARGSELKKAMTIAYGYQSMMWNRFSRQMFKAGMEWNNGNKGQAAATMAMSTVYTLALPAMVVALTKEFQRNGPQSSPQDQKKRFLTTLAEEASPLKFIPLARDLQAFAIRGASGERQRDLQLSPLEGMFQSLIEPVAQAASGKHSSHLAEQSVNDLSFAFGIPKQVNDVAFNFLDWQHDHGALTWRDALSRRHKK